MLVAQIADSRPKEMAECTKECNSVRARNTTGMTSACYTRRTAVLLAVVLQLTEAGCSQSVTGCVLIGSAVTFTVLSFTTKEYRFML